MFTVLHPMTPNTAYQPKEFLLLTEIDVEFKTSARWWSKRCWWGKGNPWILSRFPCLRSRKLACWWRPHLRECVRQTWVSWRTSGTAAWIRHWVGPGVVAYRISDIRAKLISNSNLAKSRLSRTPISTVNSFRKCAQSTTILLQWSVQNIKTIWNLNRQLWANTFSRNLKLGCVSDSFKFCFKFHRRLFLVVQLTISHY